eukprot:scaffold13712_cov121-Skeletonema_dohrnii-CCMP3373.AAC.3
MSQAAPTSRPSKARKSSDAYTLFDPCAKSTKSPSKSPTSKSPTAKSGKCKSSKAPTAAPVAPAPAVTIAEPAAQPEPETILESATTTTTTLVETPEPGSTAERPVYFVPGSGGGSASGGEGLSGDGGGTESGTEPTEAVSGSTAEGGVLFVEIDESAAAGNSTVAGASAAENSIAVGASATAENTTTAGVTTVEESTLAGTTAVEDSCVVEASSPADGTTVVVPIEYSAVTEDGTAPLPILDYMIAEYVAYDMFSCAKARARRSLQASYPLRKGGRALEELGCVGINSEPEEVAIPGESCDLAVEDGQSCSVVEGGVGLVISDPATENAAKEKALGSINTAFGNDVFTDSNSNYYVPGLVALEMNPEKEEKVIPAATAATINSSEAATAPISTAGAVVLSLGLIAFIALALMAFRHKRKRDSAYDEFDDDFDDLAAKETSSTDGSLDDILRDLDNAYGNQVDVHHCNSAMCQICNGNQTMFIDAGDNDTVSEMYPDQFEVGGADRNRSFEYTAKPGASSPRFDNPANIRPRLYEVEDTVDL